MATAQTLTIRQSRRPQINLQIQSGFFTILNEDIRNLICQYLFGCTCQRAYKEGIHVLYSTNVFKFSQDAGLDRWMDSIKVLRWDLIRKVDLRIPLAVDLWQWEQTWEKLRAMPYLRSAKLRCESKIKLVYQLSGRLTCEIKDPFKGGRFFLPWALNPMLWPRMSDEITFEILFNVEKRKTLGILLKELRAREMRGIKIGWVTWAEFEEISRIVEAARPLDLAGPEELKRLDFFSLHNWTSQETIKCGNPAAENIPSTNKKAGTSSITTTMVRFETGDEQSHSRFFTKLHPDVRREIFLHLFGSRHVHVMFSSCEMNARKFWRHGHPPLTHVGWLHCVCRPGAKLLPHGHDEYTHKWRYLSTKILWTCKRAYEEGIALLYSTNTFLCQNPIDLINFNSIAIDHVRFIRFLELHMSLYEPETWRKETDAFRLVVSTLLDRENWGALRLVKIRVVDELEDPIPKRQKQKVRRETQREFGRAVRALAERVRVEVILGDKGDKEIIQPRSPLDQPGLSFVNASEHFPDRQGDEDQGIDSDDDDAFHRVIGRVYRAGI
ncbi:hypothetical protein NCS57_00708100 [Fusarium keratoplasticum]|uniref:Uncharacterized protein n=1 Tax=Fusarium keratoplasticum TaxID=1328300 RepID=A0ACC0QVE0_9HYPO|nr:hypothetical protein NCS57_00708100 [Fusarium keratoplasticum]KAI8668949.1 hypothetical protein NCS57_00708100 [Fusarium keratoplasticum]